MKCYLDGTECKPDTCTHDSCDLKDVGMGRRDCEVIMKLVKGLYYRFLCVVGLVGGMLWITAVDEANRLMALDCEDAFDLRYFDQMVDEYRKAVRKWEEYING